MIDDEPLLLELARLILEPMGYQIRTFSDPEEAVKAYSDAPTKPDLIITDFSMRKLTGTRIMQICRRLNPRQKIAIVSGTVGPEVFAGLSDQPDRFLSKPYEATDLQNLVRDLLGQPSAHG